MMVPRSIYSYYNITWMGKYRKNSKICAIRCLMHFVGLYHLSTNTSFILLVQVQESRSSVGLEYTLMSGFGNLEIWSYGSWDNSLFPIYYSWSSTFLSRHGGIFFHGLTLYWDISLRWGVLCPPLEMMHTWFVYRRYPIMIIYLPMILVTIILLIIIFIFLVKLWILFLSMVETLVIFACGWSSWIFPISSVLFQLVMNIIYFVGVIGFFY